MKFKRLRAVSIVFAPCSKKNLKQKKKLQRVFQLKVNNGGNASNKTITIATTLMSARGHLIAHSLNDIHMNIVHIQEHAQLSAPC